MANRRSAVELQKAAEDAVLQEKREIVGMTLDINRSTTWKKVKVQKGCRLETGKYPGIPCKVARIAGCFNCSLETFVSCMQNPENNATFDQGLRVNEVIGMTPASKTSYVSYNSTTLISARDFCLKTSDFQLDGKDISSILESFEGDQEGIGFDHSMIPEGGVPDSLFGHALGSVNSEEAKPRENFIRGVIHAHGYIALSGWARDGKSTLVINIIATDPKGNIPGFAFESTYPSYCDRLDKIRQLCESMERIEDETATTEEAEAFQQEVAARASRVSLTRVADERQRAQKVETEVAAASSSQNDGLTANERTVMAAFNQEDEKAENAEVVAVEATGDDASVFADVAPSPKVASLPASPSKASETTSVEEKEDVTEQNLERAVVEKKTLTKNQRQLFEKLVKLHNRPDWKMGRVLQGCLLEEVSVPEFSKGLKATRLSTDVKCSLDTFFKFQSDIEKLRECDPTLDVYKVLKNSEEVDTIYTSFKQLTRLIKPRDFCTDTSLGIITSDQASSLDLFGVEDGKRACIQASADNTTARSAAPGYIRGSVFVYGCLAFTTDTDSSIKLFTVGLADPGGSIPKWLIDAAKEEGCKKLALTRKLLEDFQIEIDRKSRLEKKVQKASVPKPREAPQANTVTESRSEEPESTSGSQPTTSSTSQISGSAQIAQETLDGEDSPPGEEEREVKEFQEEEEQLEAFYTEDVDAIINPLTLTHRKARWESYNTLEDLKVETASRLERKEDRVIRVYGDLMCSLEDFITAVNDEALLKKFDASIESSSVLESPPYGTVRHVKRKSSSKGINTKHDTCSLTVYHLLTDHEGHTQHGLYSPTIRSAVYVVGSVDSKDMPVVKGYERFSVGVDGLIAIATPPEAPRIRIFSITTAKNTDVSKNKKTLEGYAHAAAGRIAKMRTYFEARRKAAKLTDKPQLPPNNAPPATVTSSVFSPSADSDRYCDAQKIAIKLFNDPKWGPKRRVGSCEVAELSNANFGQTVIKVTREFMCSLSTLKQALDNVKSVTRYDPTIQSYQSNAVDRPDGGDSLACSNLSLQFKSKSSKILGAKTICVAQSSRFYNQEEAMSSGLYSSGIKSAGFVSAGVDAKLASQSNAVVEQYSFVGLATPPEATRIRVAHFFCVDPSNGAKKKIDKSTWESACKDASNRLLFLSAMCEKLEQQRQDRTRIQDVTPAVQALPPPPEVADSKSLVPVQELALDPMATTTNTKDESVDKPSSPSVQKQEQEENRRPIETHVDPTPQTDDPMPEESDATIEAVTKAQLNVIRPVFALMGRTDWKMGKVVQGCLYEDCTVTYSKIKATRITTDMKCSVEAFEAFLKDEAMVRKNDPTIDKMDVLEDTGDTKVIYTSYKRISRLLTPRDFCAVGIHCHVTPDYAKKTFGVNLPTVAYVNALSNSDRVGAKKDYVRGIIHNFGYIVCPDTGAGGKGQGIKVTQVGCVDPGGKIPNWILEAAKEETCKKLAGLRELVEKYSPK